MAISLQRSEAKRAKSAVGWFAEIQILAKNDPLADGRLPSIVRAFRERLNIGWKANVCFFAPIENWPFNLLFDCLRHVVVVDSHAADC